MGGDTPHFFERLVYGGECRVDHGRLRDIIEAYHGDILGHAQAPASHGIHHPHGHHIVGGKDGGGRHRYIQQGLGAGVAIQLLKISFVDQLGREGDMVRTQGRTIAIQAVARTAKVHGAGDKTDPDMPKFDQIFGGVISPLPVGRTHSGAIPAGALVIDENEWKLALGQISNKIHRAAR